MNIENLKQYYEDNKRYDNKIGIYKTVNTYGELCELLQEKKKEGNTKKSQEREWGRYFDYEKKGRQFIIKEIYEEPLEKAQGKEKYENPEQAIKRRYKKENKVIDNVVLIKEKDKK